MDRGLSEGEMLAIKLTQPNVLPQGVDAAAEAMRSGWIGMGPKVAAFEKAFADYLGLAPSFTPVAVNSCTAAMHMALRMLRLEPGTEVVTTAMTFVATNQILLWDQLKPVFADIDPATGNISADSVAEKITARTGAIMAVHFAGQPCDLAALNAVAARAGIPIIEDCAHACGSHYRGQPVGSSQNWCAFSFGSTKALTTIDGGMLIMPAHLAPEARMFRTLGQSSDIFKRVSAAGSTGPFWEYDVPVVGRRYHMNDVSAAMGLAHLPHLDAANRRRAAIAALYDAELRAVPGIRLLRRDPASVSSHYMYVILAQHRDRLAESLRARGITVGVHYKPNTFFPIFEHTPLPQTEAFYTHALSLPMYPALRDHEVAQVAQAIRAGW